MQGIHKGEAGLRTSWLTCLLLNSVAGCKHLRMHKEQLPSFSICDMKVYDCKLAWSKQCFMPFTENIDWYLGKALLLKGYASKVLMSFFHHVTCSASWFKEGSHSCWYNQILFLSLNEFLSRKSWGLPFPYNWCLHSIAVFLLFFSCETPLCLFDNCVGLLFVHPCFWTVLNELSFYPLIPACWFTLSGSDHSDLNVLLVSSVLFPYSFWIYVFRFQIESLFWGRWWFFEFALDSAMQNKENLSFIFEKGIMLHAFPPYESLQIQMHYM